MTIPVRIENMYKGDTPQVRVVHRTPEGLDLGMPYAIVPPGETQTFYIHGQVQLVVYEHTPEHDHG